MAIYLGNLSVEDLERRLEIELTEEERETLTNMREETCDKVDGNNKIHIYDIPFLIECGNPDARRTVIKILSPYASKMAMPLQIGGGVD